MGRFYGNYTTSVEVDVDIPVEEIIQYIKEEYAPCDIFPEFCDTNEWEPEEILYHTKEMIISQKFTLEEIESIKKDCEYILNNYKKENENG